MPYRIAVDAEGQQAIDSLLSNKALLSPLTDRPFPHQRAPLPSGFKLEVWVYMADPNPDRRPQSDNIFAQLMYVAPSGKVVEMYAGGSASTEKAAVWSLHGLLALDSIQQLLEAFSPTETTLVDPTAVTPDEELPEVPGFGPVEKQPASEGPSLEQQLLARLSRYAGEKGESEGAVDTLDRLLRELEVWRRVKQQIVHNG